MTKRERNQNNPNTIILPKICQKFPLTNFLLSMSDFLIPAFLSTIINLLNANQVITKAAGTINKTNPKDTLKFKIIVKRRKIPNLGKASLNTFFTRKSSPLRILAIAIIPQRLAKIAASVRKTLITQTTTFPIFVKEKLYNAGIMIKRRDIKDNAATGE